jgi:hypothetical protein
MEVQEVHRSESLPARRGHDAFVRGTVTSLVLGLAIWLVIVILGFLLVVR